LRRSKRNAQTVAQPAPAIVGRSGAAKPTDGIDGYVATSSGVGTKASAPILRLPLSVSIVTAQEMADRDVQTTRDALQYTAGVNTYFREGQFTREYGLIRGFQGLQFIDGLRSNVSNYGIEPYGMERIDVLKGPAATLYGQGSPGGLWDMTSKRPTDQAFNELVLRASSYNGLQGAFDVGGPVTADHSLLYRFVGVGKVGDGQIDFTKNDRVYLAPSFTWRPNEDTSLTVLASYQYDPNLTVLQPLPYKGTIVPGPTGQFISRNLFLGEPAYHNTSVEQVRIGYQLDHRIDDVFSFQQNFAYQNIDIKLNEVQSLTNPNTTTTSRYMANQVFNIDMYQIDNKLKADFETGLFRHHMMFGIDYSATPNYQGTGTNTASPYTLNLYNPVYGQPLAANVPITSNRYQDQRQLGFYAQDRVELGRWTFMAGARMDELVQGQVTRVLNTGTGVLSNPAWGVQQDNAATYNGGVIYTFDNGIAPYFSYSQTFTPTTGTDFFGNPFVPTTGEQKEVGIKYQPPGLNLLVTGAVFDITQNNVLTRDLAPGHGGFAVQTSSVGSRGAEFELKTTHLYGFNVAAAYTYLDAKVISSNTAGVTGRHPIAIPMNQASLWTTYRFAGGWVEGLTLGGGVRYIGDQAGDALNSFAVPSFTLFDLTARYDLGVLFKTLDKWDVAVNVKNVADKRYVGSCDDAVDCYYGPGRYVSGTLRARF
jgi:iron complex outermembrane receptor protein